MAPKRAALFVDVANLFHAAERLRRGPRRLRPVPGPGLAGRATSHAGAGLRGADGPRGRAVSCAVLRGLGYETRYRPAVVVASRPDIRRTDRNVAMAVDVWRLAGRFDVAIIGSNDPDLAPLWRGSGRPGPRSPCVRRRRPALAGLADRVIDALRPDGPRDALDFAITRREPWPEMQSRGPPSPMKLQTSPNRWSCLPTSFAMALDVRAGQVIKWLGHDGSQVVLARASPSPTATAASTPRN